MTDVIKFIRKNSNKEKEAEIIENLKKKYTPEQVSIFLADAKLPFWEPGKLSIDNKSKSGFPSDNIINALKKTRVLILEAETGVGKTTQLPRILLESAGEQKIIITQPRILVSRSIAERLAGQFNEQPSTNGNVGYITGPYKEYSNKNKIWVMTEGILNHYLVNSEKRKNLLESVAYFILDEIHEKTLEMELILYYLQESMNNNNKFKVIITSATFNPKTYAEFFKEYKPIIAKISGISAKKDVIFLPNPVPDYIATITDIIDDIIKNYNMLNKDILIFLPTMKAIAKLESLLYNKVLENNLYKSIYISKLFSGIQKVEEEIIYKNVSELITLAKIPATRRIILSTDVSETGFTFKSLGYVIDSGFVNQSYYDPYLNANMLLISEISQDTARQRWGRVGRVSDGVVFPIYTKQEYERMDPERKAQIYLKPLSKFTLNLLIFGESNSKKKKPFDYTNARLFNNPPVDAMLRATDTLVKTYAINRNSKVTNIGKKLEGFRPGPLRAKVIFHAIEYLCVYQAIIVICMLEIGIDKLIDIHLCKVNCYNEFQSDFLSYYCIYEAFQKHRFDRYFLISNGFKYESFLTLEDDILTVQKNMVEIGLPLINIPLSPDKLAIGLNHAFIEAGYFNNVAQQDPDNPTYYNYNKIKGMINISLTFPANALGFEYKQLLPKYILFENLTVKKLGKEGIISYIFNVCSKLESEAYDSCTILSRLCRELS